MNTTPAAPLCDAQPCEMFVSGSSRYCDRHRDIGLDDFGNRAEWLGEWLDDHADARNSFADFYAQVLYCRALDYLHAFIAATIYGDGSLVENIIDPAAALFGYRKCDTCGDLTHGEELDVNEMCPNCLDTLDGPDDDRAAFPYCRECLTYIDGYDHCYKCRPDLND